MLNFLVNLWTRLPYWIKISHTTKTKKIKIRLRTKKKRLSRTNYRKNKKRNKKKIMKRQRTKFLSQRAHEKKCLPGLEKNPNRN